VAVDRADGVVFAWGWVLALFDPVGDGDGSSGVDAGVVAPVDGAGDVPELDRDGCAQPVNDIAVAMSATTTNRIRLGISVHPISTPWTSGRLAWVPSLAPRVHVAPALQQWLRGLVIRV
jgi:hypothetical protein